MNFLTPSYFLFFPVAAVLYFVLPVRCKNPWLLLCSWFFYLCAGPEYFVFLLFAIAVTYFAGLQLDKKPARLTLVLAAGSLLLLLFVFKYLGFALSLVSRALSALGLAIESPALSLILPAGISFYLFQSIGYVIDVYRGKRPAERSFVKYALFVSFFPSLLSGPIGRSDQLLPQFDTPKRFSWTRVKSGLIRFLWGAFQKLVVADRLGVVTAAVFAAPQDYSTAQLWAAAIGFSLQIYCDFAAYSDMATGCAEVMGFSLIQNFRTPYFSRSIQEFWRRWHISLSTWFRDYLYIPLGGSRRGTARKYLNVLIVFGVSGLWHGAALTFVVWGLLNGLYQVIGGVTAALRRRVRTALHLRDDGKLCALWQISFTFVLATLAWVFFKSGSLSGALDVLSGMAVPQAGTGLALFSGRRELAAALGGLLLVLVRDLWSLKTDPYRSLAEGSRALRWVVCLGLLMLTLICGIYGTGYDAQDFIYFNF